MKNKIIKASYMTAVVFIAHYFSSFLEQMVVAGDKLAWLYLFMWYALFLYFGEELYTKVIK